MARRRQTAPSVSFFAFQDIITSVVGIFVLITLVMILEVTEQPTPSTDARQAVTQAMVDMHQSLEAEVRELQSVTDSLLHDSQQVSGLPKAAIQRLQAQTEQQLQFAKAESERLELASLQMQKGLQSEQAELVRLESEWQSTQPREKELEELKAAVQKSESKIALLDEDPPLFFNKARIDGKSLYILDVSVSGLDALSLSEDQRDRFPAARMRVSLKSWLASKDAAASHILILVRPMAVTNFNTVRELVDRSGFSYGFDVMESERKIMLRGELE